MRINQFLSRAGLGSRRGVEELVLSGRVQVQGLTMTDLSYHIQIGEEVRFDGKSISLPASFTYLALFKPKEYLTSKKDNYHEKTIYTLLPPEYQGLSYAGRLDLDSRGLLLLSNDGSFVQEITHPSQKIDKEYEVTTKDPMEYKAILEEFLIGIRSEGETLRMKEIKPVGTSLGKSNRFVCILSEGKKRQIRRMFQAKGISVSDLLRTRIGKLKLESLNLKEGEYRLVSKESIL